MSLNGALREIAKARLAATRAGPYLHPTISELFHALRRATEEVIATNMQLELDNMRRQEYEMITSAIRRAVVDAPGTNGREGVKRAAVEIADAFAREKPGFDYHKFLTDSGVRT